MTYLIDSDRIIEYLKNVPAIMRLLDPWLNGLACMSVVSYGEVFEGILGSREQEADAFSFRTFIESVSVIGIDVAVAERFSAIRLDLRRRGLLISDNDLWIASTAVEYDLTLVTGNRRHFDRVPGLKIYE